jgi:hypothetical protein
MPSDQLERAIRDALRKGFRESGFDAECGAEVESAVRQRYHDLATMAADNAWRLLGDQKSPPGEMMLAAVVAADAVKAFHNFELFDGDVYTILRKRS